MDGLNEERLACRNTGYEYGIPDNVIAAGNPCRILRKITDEDRKYYFQRREFDVPME